MQNNVKIPPQLPAFTVHPQSVRCCLATGTEVNRSTKMVASEKQKNKNSLLSDDSALNDLKESMELYLNVAQSAAVFKKK